MDIEQIRQLAVRNVDPVRFPVSAELFEEIRRQGDEIDAIALSAALVTAVMRLESRNADAIEVLVDSFKDLLGVSKQLLDAVGAESDVLRAHSAVIQKIGDALTQIVDRIEPPTP